MTYGANTYDEWATPMTFGANTHDEWAEKGKKSKKTCESGIIERVI